METFRKHPRPIYENLYTVCTGNIYKAISSMVNGRTLGVVLLQAQGFYNKHDLFYWRKQFDDYLLSTYYTLGALLS